jgi:hypothetical protein
MISMPLSREYPMGEVQGDEKGEVGVPLREVMARCTESWAHGYVDCAERGDVEAMIAVAQFHLKPEGWAGVIHHDIAEGVRWCNKIEVFDADNPILPRMREHFGIDRHGLVDEKQNATASARWKKKKQEEANSRLRHENQIRELMVSPPTSDGGNSDATAANGSVVETEPSAEDIAKVMGVFANLGMLGQGDSNSNEAKS